MPVHDFKRLAERMLSLLVCLAVFCPLLLTPPAGASEAGAEPGTETESGTEDTTIQNLVETFLRNYQEQAMLYEDRDLRSGTVADPALLLPDRAETQVYHIGRKDVTLAQLRENFVYLEKKAAFYAAMRQMQGIYRDNLQLVYTMSDMEVPALNVGSVSVKETAQFRYTDSDRLSVNETFYTVYLVYRGDQWLIADVTDGSRFDTIYKSQGAAFDEETALAEFAANLERDGCTLSFPYTPSEAEGRILYNGANAAAYAYTYARPDAGAPRSAFYNSQFYSYAGEGGDCQNFASQCMWAGFGGSQTDAAVKEHSLPMDVSGDSQWFGRAASGGKINYSWISCQSFRKYLTGSADGTGRGSSNAAADTGMYATILDVDAASGFSGVTAEELVGAAAHVEGVGGAYAHAIVLTAATGTRRSEIWFCGHTKEASHIKLGDYYIWPMKVYIPRYLRTGDAAGRVETDLLQPVAAGGAGLLTARAGETQYQITITVTPPGGAAEQAASVNWAESCQAEYVFSVPGLYQVVSAAKASEKAGWVTNTWYVRCYEPPVLEEAEEAGETEDQPEESAETEETTETAEIPEAAEYLFFDIEY